MATAPGFGGQPSSVSKAVARATTEPASLDVAWEPIRRAHYNAADPQVREIAMRMCKQRGLDPQAIVANGPVNVLVDAQGKTAVTLIVSDPSTQFLPQWKLFEADARSARDAVNPPAPTKEEAQAKAITNAFTRTWKTSADLWASPSLDARQLADV